MSKADELCELSKAINILEKRVDALENPEIEQRDSKIRRLYGKEYTSYAERDADSAFNTNLHNVCEIVRIGIADSDCYEYFKLTSVEPVEYTHLGIHH